MTAAPDWDVVVIGAGMGGGIAARALAEAGLRVLVLEKGRVGYRTEETGVVSDAFDPVARGLRGLWPLPVSAQVDGRDSRFFAPLGCGVGGSSVFYAATLERPEPHDLDHSEARPHPTGGWPVGWAGMRPWYDRAQEVLELVGEPDPLGTDPGPLQTPPSWSTADTALADGMRARGLHPYRSHSAIRYLPGCTECLGRKCPRVCKLDGRSAGIESALATGRVELRDRCDVRAIRGAGRQVSHLEVTQGDKDETVTARAYVLAAGALHSPRLMLRSVADWPGGCGNSSGLVGKGLMFHLNEMVAVWPGRAASDAASTKAISVRDLYWQDGRRQGMVQSMGIEAGYGEILFYLRGTLARSALGRLRAVQELASIPAALAARALGRAKVLVGILEDLPYDSNQVRDGATPDDVAITYRIAPELRARRRAFRRAMRRGLGWRSMFLNRGPELNFGHPSGTLRFGRDPATSVLDASCRAHDLDNLWVADASFMPTSMGVNPSLTIAANALRVADTIARSLNPEDRP